MKRFYSVTTMLAALAAIVGPTTSAHAGDGKMYPGSICHIEYGGTSGFVIADFSYQSTTQGHWVTCPLVRDTVSSTSGLSSLDVYSGQNQFVTGSSCEARSLGTAGGGVARYSSKALPGFNSGTNKISFGSALNGGYDWGMYSLSCGLQGRYSSSQLYGAYIAQINATEN